MGFYFWSLSAHKWQLPSLQKRVYSKGLIVLAKVYKNGTVEAYWHVSNISTHKNAPYISIPGTSEMAQSVGHLLYTWTTRVQSQTSHMTPPSTAGIIDPSPPTQD